MRKFSAACLIVAFASSAAVAADTNVEKPKKDPDKIICRSDRTTGSVIAERVCKKRSVWDQEEQDAQDLLDRRNHRQTRPVLPGGGGG